jgi:hypothetical protein
MSPVATRGRPNPPEDTNPSPSQSFLEDTPEDGAGEDTEPSSLQSSSEVTPKSATMSTSSTYEGLRLTYTAPRLNKTNYVDWAAKTENLLEIQGVWAIVNGEDKQPNGKASEEATRAWKKGNGIALEVNHA